MSDDETTIADPTDRPLPVSGGIAAAEVTEGPKLAEFMNKLLLIQFLQDEQWDTTQGPADVSVCYILAIDYTMNADNEPVVTWDDLGETPVFWSFVKKQIKEQSSPETPWVLGKLSKGSRAYRINPPIPEDLRAAAIALEEWRTLTEEAF